MFVVIIKEVDDDTGEALVQNVFGPFSESDAAAEYGERKIQDYDGDYSIGWSVVAVQTPE